MKSLLCLFITLGLAQVACAQSSFAFKEITPTGLQLSENGKPVFVYNFGMILAPGFPEAMRRSTYLHPVYAPDGVTVLTDDFNKDHPHHRGICWVWPVVTVDGKKGDIWTVKGYKQRFVAWKARDTQGGVARLAIENGWFDGDRKFVKEDVEILVQPAANNQRVMDFTLSFQATDKPVEIIGTPEEKKGYGGFCLRTAPRDGGPAKTEIRTDQGLAKDDGVNSRHPWAEITGLFNGQPAGVRIEDNAANPGYPNNGWLMRHSFAFLNCSYPGLTPLILQPGKPLVLKYRVILYCGQAAKR